MNSLILTATILVGLCSFAFSMPKRNEDLRHQKAMIVANRLLKELADETADKSAKPTDKIQQIHEDENNFQFDELDELLPLLINEPWFQKLAEEQLADKDSKHKKQLS